MKTNPARHFQVGYIHNQRNIKTINIVNCITAIGNCLELQFNYNLFIYLLLYLIKVLFWPLWLVFHLLQNSICLAKEGNSGLKQLLSKWSYKNKTQAYFNSWVNYSFNVNKSPNTKRKITHYSWLKNFNTFVLIGIHLYSVLFLYLFIQFLECSW